MTTTIDAYVPMVETDESDMGMGKTTMPKYADRDAVSGFGADTTDADNDGRVRVQIDVGGGGAGRLVGEMASDADVDILGKSKR
jgi:hypothetical protein